MEPNWEVFVEYGWKNKADEKKLIEYFIGIADKYPYSARAKFELANAYDYLGKEEQAITLYEDAIRMGLEPKFEAAALIQLGSSLRTVGRVEEAIDILTDAEKRFSEFPSITMFLSMAMHDKKMETEAIRKLLIAMIRHTKTSDIERYRGALENYIKEI